MQGSLARGARRERAEELATERAKRTPEEQLKRLDKMFGKGKGAAKERAKLEKQASAKNK